ncbi:MAG: ATP-binding protein [Acidimicrobiales bacterium]
MTEAVIDFASEPLLGKVARVDTNRVTIVGSDAALVTRVSVGDLVAVQGALSTEFLIGIVDRVIRDTEERLSLDDVDDDEDIAQALVAERDLLRLVLVGTYRTVEGSAHNTFKRGADSFPKLDRSCFLVEGGNLQLLMSLLSAGVPTEERLVLGSFVADSTASAIADGNRLFQRHGALLGSTGSGKSWTVALILERASKLKFPNLIVFDLHGEYAPLTDEAEGFAQSFRVAGPGDLAAPGEDVLFLPHWLLNHEEMLAMLLDRSDSNAPNQAARFLTHVRTLKAATLTTTGHPDVATTFTVDSPIPYSMDDLLSALTTDDEEMVPGAVAGKEKQGPYFGKLTRFVQRLEAKRLDRRYGFMFEAPAESMQYEWLPTLLGRLLSSENGQRGIKIIDFSEVPSDVLPVVVGVLGRLVFELQFWMSSDARTPVSLVCDEAHLYMPVRDSADAVATRGVEVFERIAKEGRKYGVSLLIVSQRPADVSRTVLSQCNNFVVLRLTNDQDQSVVQHLMPESMGGLTAILPLLDVGEALVLGDAVVLPTRIQIDPPKIKPDSATHQFWTEWAATEAPSAAIALGVEAMRRQSRPPT